jgi:hypothetical protein
MLRSAAAGSVHRWWTAGVGSDCDGRVRRAHRCGRRRLAALRPRRRPRKRGPLRVRCHVADPRRGRPRGILAAADGREATRTSVWPAALNVSPGTVPRAAASRAAASLRRRSTPRTRAGSTGSSSRVRASIRYKRRRLSILRLIFSLPTWQGATHCAQHPGFRRPSGQVQVERSHRGEALAVVDAERLGGDPLAVGGAGRLVHGAKPLLPRLVDLGRQVEAFEYWVVSLQVGPEELAR